MVDAIHSRTTIQDLTLLSELLLDRTAITDEGTKHLIRLRALKVLGLSETNITDVTLQYFHEQVASFRGILRELNMARTQVTEKGMKFLAGMFSPLLGFGIISDSI